MLNITPPKDLVLVFGIPNDLAFEVFGLYLLAPRFLKNTVKIFLTLYMTLCRESHIYYCIIYFCFVQCQNIRILTGCRFISFDNLHSGILTILQRHFPPESTLMNSFIHISCQSNPALLLAFLLVNYSAIPNYCLTFNPRLYWKICG